MPRGWLLWGRSDLINLIATNGLATLQLTAEVLRLLSFEAEEEAQVEKSLLSMKEEAINERVWAEALAGALAQEKVKLEIELGWTWAKLEWVEAWLKNEKLELNKALA